MLHQCSFSPLRYESHLSSYSLALDIVELKKIQQHTFTIVISVWRILIVMWSCISPMTNDTEHLFMCLFSGPELEWGNWGDWVQNFRRHLFSGSGASVEQCRHHTWSAQSRPCWFSFWIYSLVDVSIESFTLFFFTVNFFIEFWEFSDYFWYKAFIRCEFCKKKKKLSPSLWFVLLFF